jgi:hypothetical protein
MRFPRLITIAAGLLAAAASHAQTGPIRVEGTTVIVNEVPVMQFRISYNGTPPENRAGLAIQRLQNTTGDITVSGSGDVRKILRGSSVLAVVTQDDAASAGQSLTSLASTFYSSLKDALTLPPLKIVQDNIKIPIGEDRTIKLVGTKAFAANVATPAPQIARGQRTPDGIKVSAVSQGATTLTITAGNQSIPLNVEVWPYASNFPQTVNASVIGLPAATDTVQGAVEAAVRTQVQAVNGSALTFTIPSQPSIDIGNSTSFDVKVHVDAPHAFGKDGVVHVNLRNLPIGRKPEAQLWYCNDPENLAQAGPLFAAPLMKDTPVRLLYHHYNASIDQLFVRIQLVNDSDTPARVVITPGDAKPDKNPVLAGLLAADQFLRHWMTGSGEVVFIGPHCSTPISIHRLLPGDTVSGLCALRLIDGPNNVVLRADAIPPFDLDTKWSNAVNSLAPWRFVGAAPMTYIDNQPTVTTRHIYPDPYKQEDVNYQVGGRYGFVRIGQKPISNATMDAALEGNFGVVYTIKANMTNLTSSPADVEVMFEASAGYAGALFLVNGQVKRTLPLPPKASTQLTMVHLDPGQSKSVTLVTIPHSGGSYPATITIRPVQAEGT